MKKIKINDFDSKIERLSEKEINFHKQLRLQKDIEEIFELIKTKKILKITEQRELTESDYTDKSIYIIEVTD